MQNSNSSNPHEENLPRHIAIVMDGNGRWAKKRRLPRIAGHRAGVEAVREIIKVCGEKGIGALTLFAFSTENWNRPVTEVNALMDLFLGSLEREANKLQENNVQLRFIGNYFVFEERLKNKIIEVQERTKQNTGLKLVIAANYGGHWDIVQAAKRLASDVKEGQLDVADVTNEIFKQYLSTTGLPDPDLFIRTSGEFRISNFLNWQLSYTEMYFTETLWPDFDLKDFERALLFFKSRDRRFGGITEEMNHA